MAATIASFLGFPAPEPVSLSEEATRMPELAETTEGMDYDLPFGKSFTSSGAGQDLL